MSNNKPPNSWMYAGLASTYPNIEPPSTEEEEEEAAPNKAPKTKLHNPHHDPSTTHQPCKIFQQSIQPDTPPLSEVALEKAQLSSSILMFRYRGKIHAIDHACPHQSYPLTRATLHDIEDFGIVLSAGITCPKHGWTFDLYTGEADRGRYRLAVYEVDLRKRVGGGGDGGGDGGDDDEVWIRKKERRRIG